MCGIAGFVGAFHAGLVSAMNDAQASRGPDGAGVFESADEEAALGHRRLAILDLSQAAAQPMHSPDGRYVLVYNGEIYNYRDLREELAFEGPYRSTGDTEVLLRGLVLYGPSFLARLNGIFAMALWDRRERALLLARDPMGVKPLYLAEPVPGTVLFASEMKALCVHPRLRREPDFVALQQHLAFCHASGERTALRGVRRLEAGTFLSWEATGRVCRTVRFWRPTFGAYSRGDRRAAAAALRDAVAVATRRQMIADVPVGSLLSGGLDSSLVTAFAVPVAASGFSAFTITYPASENVVDRFEPDAPHAERVAAELGVSLERIEIRPDVATLWPRLVYALDEPVADPAAIASYLICRAARERGTPVLLSGQGADELFGGYPRYRAMRATAPLAAAPAPVRRALAAAARFLPGSREGAAGAGARRLRRVVAGLGEAPDRRFLGLAASAPQAVVSSVLGEAFADGLAGEGFAVACLDHMEGLGLRGLDRLQERDIAVYLPNHNLLYGDKTGMAAGVEVRVPLLDLELVAMALQLPPAWRVTARADKVLLRDAARGVIPDAVIDRRKAGFGAPLRKWMRYDLAEMWGDLTSPESVRRRGWFSSEGLARLRSDSQEGREDSYLLQWAVLTVELWARAFIDTDVASRRMAVGS